MPRTLILTLLILLFSFCTYAQTKYTISGTIRAGKTGESAIRATVLVSEHHLGITTNEYGFFSLTLLAGHYTLVISAVSMQPQTLDVDLTKDIRLDVSLEAAAAQLQSVVVSAAANESKLAGTAMGVDRLSASTVRDLPAFLGTPDVLKTIQLLPGVASAGDGNTGFYVRGGAPDQNLILLDGATVYNPSHLLGFISTFNPDAVRDVTLYKGDMPPAYGGRLSSIAAIRMSEGNNQTFHVNAGVGVITSGIEAEGPITKGESSFLVAARTTRINAGLAASHDSTIDKDKIGFYDLNAKLNFRLSSSDHLYASGYLGQDNLLIYQQAGLAWGNGIASLRWNHVFGHRLFANTTVSLSNYNWKITGYTNGATWVVTSNLDDWSFKQQWEWYPAPRHTVRFGAESIYHDLHPAKLNAQPETGLSDTSFQARYGWENALFAGDDWAVNDRLTLTYGARFTNYTVLGPGNFYDVNPAGVVIKTNVYSPAQSVVNYFHPEPRVGVAYVLDSRSTIKASYARMVQNVHQLTNSAESLPTQRWDLTNNNIQPEISDQVSLGYYRETADRMYSWSVETFYKKMQHQIDVRTGAQIETTDIVDAALLYGQGRAYGVEGQLKKNKGKLTGWISYTLSRAQLQIDSINHGEWYMAPQDRTHNVAIVAIYHPNEKWSFSANWVYYTGSPVSYPNGKYDVDGRNVFYFASRNGDRLPAYHRLDLGATRHYTHKKYKSDLSFGAYNAYDHYNAYYISYRQNPNNPDQEQAVQTTLFGIIPYIAYTIKF
jgi:hypothetical protein